MSAEKDSSEDGESKDDIEFEETDTSDGEVKIEESINELQEEILQKLQDVEEREILTKIEKIDDDSIDISSGDVMKKVGDLNGRCDDLENPSFKTKTWKIEEGVHHEIDLFGSILEINEFNKLRQEGILEEKIQKQEIYTAMAVVALENRKDVVETILAFRAKRKDNIK